MLPLDLDALAGVIHDAISVATAPLLDRIKSLELAATRRDADPALEEYRRRVEELATELAVVKASRQEVDVEVVAFKAASLLPAPKDGRDAVVDLDALALKAAALVPRPKDGRDAEPVDLETLAVKAAALVPRPRDGKDAEPIDLHALATKAAALVPVPKDGRDGVDGRDGADAVIDLDAIAAKAAALIPVPKDGKDGKDGAPGRDGRDGGPGIQGPPGQDGKNGADGAVGTVGPEGKQGPQGERGAPGEDGIGFDDADLVFDGASKRFVLTFTKGDRVREFPVPIPIDRGVYSDHETYHKGQMVSRGGSMWLALLDGMKGVRPDDKTTEGARGWRLCVQRGKEGKQGQQGIQGPPGRDLRWEREE